MIASMKSGFLSLVAAILVLQLSSAAWAQPCSNVLSLDIVDPRACYAEGDTILVEANMSCLDQVVTGFQAFLEFNATLVQYEGLLSSYTVVPFPLHIQQLGTAEVNPGELNVDGSASFNGSGTDQDSLLATLVFEVLGGNDGASTAFDFRDALPFFSELSADGVPLTTSLQASATFAVDQTPPVITCPTALLLDNDAGLCGAVLDPGTASAFDACGVDTIIGVRDDAEPITELFPAGCGPTDADGTTTIDWTVTDIAGHTDTCDQIVVVQDAEPPELDVPPTALIQCGEDDQPTNTGQAGATDNCDPAPVVTFTDTVTGSCPAVITRTWTAVDACGNSSSQTQSIIVGATEQTLIIKQGACPAPVNPNSNGVVPILLVGEPGFDVSQVVISSLELRRCDGQGGFTVPLNGPPGPATKIKDLNHPFDGEVSCGDPCACNPDQSSDGIDDLAMKFRTDDLVNNLGLDVSDGTVGLQLTGVLQDGSAFVARDCIVIVPPDSEPNSINVSSNAGDTFIEMTPLDLRVDSDGFTGFARSYISGTPVTISAPLTSFGRRFLRWSVNDVMQPIGLNKLKFPLDEPLHIRAFYVHPRRVMPDRPVETDDPLE